MQSREGSAQRKLDKKSNNRLRDSDGGAGNARGFNKSVRAYGRAVIDSALEEMEAESEECTEPCVSCGHMMPPKKGLTCSKACADEYDKRVG